MVVGIIHLTYVGLLEAMLLCDIDKGAIKVASVINVWAEGTQEMPTFLEHLQLFIVRQATLFNFGDLGFQIFP